jgi:glycosyltransferase involved in cell wall biosynthesis
MSGCRGSFDHVASNRFLCLLPTAYCLLPAACCILSTLRILYFADIRFPLERANGIQTMETCHALARRGNSVQLVVRPDTERPARDPFLYYALPRLERFVIEQAPVSGPQLARRLGYLAFVAGRAIGKARAEVLMTRDLGVAALLCAMPRGMRSPLVYESHGYAPEVAAALPDLLATAERPGASKLARLARREAQVWHGAEGYVTITAGLAQDLTARHGTRPQVAVVPDGVRLSGNTTTRGFRRTEEGASTPPPIVCYAGHLYAWKGVDVLLEALARIPDAHGLIVGGHGAEPDLARVKALAARLGIDSRVTFTGLVEPARVPELLRRATVLVLPNPASAISTRYTSPLKLFEYLAAGRPIVASDLPSIREVAHDGVTALLVPPGDPDALAAAIRRLLQEPALAGRLARAAVELAPEYSWDRRAERLEALFAQITR